MKISYDLGFIAIGVANYILKKKKKIQTVRLKLPTNIFFRTIVIE